MTDTIEEILTRNEAEVELRPYLGRISKCIQGGWDAWEREYGHRHHILGPRARASIIFDETAHLAISEFDGDPRVVARRNRNSLLLFIGDNITLRFKKIGRHGRCSNVATRQQPL